MAGVFEVRARDTLPGLVERAMEWNPRVRIARQQAEQAAAGRAALDGFFDPRLASGLERFDPVTGQRGTMLHAGMTTPLWPGVYLDAALEERLFDNLDNTTDYERLFQSTARLGLNVPLRQDRGWRQWKLAALGAGHEFEAALARLLAVRQEVRWDVERRYLAAMEALAQEAVARTSTERALRLLLEAEAMVEAQALPQYQIFAARSAVALRREEEESARQAVAVSRMLLEELVAAPAAPVLPDASADDLIAWADAVELPGDYDAGELLHRRGNYARILAQMNAVRAARELEQDKLLSSLDLVVAGTLRGEDPDTPLGSGRYLSDRNFGVVAGLVWSRPWGYRAERARLRSQRALLAEREEDLRQAQQSILTELAVAHQRFTQARSRLQFASEAADAARRALDSEDERFRLGEGRSRNVLDAQKDLTDTLKRQIVTAMELLRAYYEFNYAAGYALMPRPQMQAIK